MHPRLALKSLGSEDDLELLALQLPPPKCWDHRPAPPHSGLDGAWDGAPGIVHAKQTLYQPGHLPVL